MGYSDKISKKTGKLLCSTYLAKLIKLLPSIFQQKFSISVPFAKLQLPSIQNFIADLLQINVCFCSEFLIPRHYMLGEHEELYNPNGNW